MYRIPTDSKSLREACLRVLTCLHWNRCEATGPSETARRHPYCLSLSISLSLSFSLSFSLFLFLSFFFFYLSLSLFHFRFLCLRLGLSSLSLSLLILSAARVLTKCSCWACGDWAASFWARAGMNLFSRKCRKLELRWVLRSFAVCARQSFPAEDSDAQASSHV